MIFRTVFSDTKKSAFAASQFELYWRPKPHSLLMDCLQQWSDTCQKTTWVLDLDGKMCIPTLPVWSFDVYCLASLSVKSLQFQYACFMQF